MRAVPFHDLARSHAEVREELEAAFARVLEHQEFILGREVAELERAWAAYQGAAHAVGCSNGTDAVLLALQACGIGPGDEVITAPLTFIATIEAIAALGARPVLADTDPASGLLDPRSVEAAITPRTRAVIPVHLYGWMADMDSLLALTRPRGIRCIEDAAQAHGAASKGRKAGTLGDAGCFSFFPGKNLGALGDAGAVITQDEGLARKVRSLRDHGRASRKYEHLELGWNKRMDGLQAAFLLAKLRRLPAWAARRKAVADAYWRGLQGLDGLELPPREAGEEPAFHLFVVRHPRRDWLQRELAALGIETRVHYPIPCHRQPAWIAAYGEVRFPGAEAFASACLSLPMFDTMTDEEAGAVVAALRKVLGGGG